MSNLIKILLVLLFLYTLPSEAGKNKHNHCKNKKYGTMMKGNVIPSVTANIAGKTYSSSNINTRKQSFTKTEKYLFGLGMVGSITTFFLYKTFWNTSPENQSEVLESLEQSLLDITIQALQYCTTKAVGMTDSKQVCMNYEVRKICFDYAFDTIISNIRTNNLTSINSTNMLFSESFFKNRFYSCFEQEPGWKCSYSENSVMLNSFWNSLASFVTNNFANNLCPR